MAMKISFKQQCPSCEAMVPVKDSSQIGKKIECPKCKFRFVVEAPEDEEEEAPPEPKSKKPAAKGAITTTKGAPAKNGTKTAGKNGVGAKKAGKEDDEDDAPKKKGKKKGGEGGNKNLMIGIGLAVVALALLGVGAWLFIFNKDDKGGKSKPSASSSGGSNNSNNNNAGQNDPKNQGNNQQGAVPGADITNLLPNDTQLVKHVNINVRGASAPRPFFPSKMATAMFSTPGTFNVEAFKQKFGFTLESVEQVVIAQNLKDNWVFSVLRTTQPIDRKHLTEKLKLVSAGNPAKPELEFFTAEGEFDDFSVAFFMNSKQRPMTVHFYDDNTLVLADRKVMEPFLATERKPLERTKPAEQPQQRPGGAMGAMGAIGGPGVGVPPGAGVGGGGGVGVGVSGAAQIGTPGFGRQGQPPVGAIGSPPMAAMGAMGAIGAPPMGAIGAPPMGAIGAPPMGVMGGAGVLGAPPMGALGGMLGQMGGGRPFPAPSDSYRTVDPAIKRVLDATEFKKAVVSAAGERALIKTLTNKVIDLYMDDLPSSLRKDTPRPTVPDVVAAGAVVVRELGDGGFHVGTAIAFDTTILAQAIESGTRLVASQILPQIEKGLNVKIKLLGGGGANLAGVMGAAGAIGAPPMGAIGAPPMGAIGAPPMGAIGAPPMGAIGAPPMGVMGGAGAIGAPPPAGVMGGALGAPPMLGAMGGALGAPPPAAVMGGAGAIGAPPVGVMGGAGALGAIGGQPGGGQPADNDMPDPDAGYFDPRSEGNVFLLMLHLKLSDERVHKEIIEQVEEGLAQGAVFLRNEATMVYHRSHRHQLAEALQQYLKEKNGQFPRGTYPREINDRSGAGKADNPLPFRPDERIAWTAELLPYLGEYSRLNVNRRKSWNEGMNRVAATTAVPHFLAPDEPKGRYPDDSWKVPMPGVPLAAVSHFVGVAGVGLDSATLAKEDDHPEGWKLRGVFGYDRVTKLSDIKDGPANTIAVLQVPATFKTCWLAGGGSTVRGVPEDNPLEPFVCTEYQGKLGTFAIMCDGKVRFIPADMNPETFKAMCTIAADDKVDNLDAVAPVVDQAAVVAKKDDPAPPMPVQPPPEQPKPMQPMQPQVEQPKPMAGGVALTPQLRQNDVKQIGLAYHNYHSAHNKAPAKAEDLGPFLGNDARLLGRLKSGEIVFFWNVGINQMTEGTSRTVLAYEKDVPSAGGYVLFGDGSVKQLKAQEFQAAPKAGR